MSDITLTFEGHTVRVIMRDGEPWWVLADICVVLEHSNPSMMGQTLDPDERDALSIVDPMGREQQTTIVSEPGLYKLLQTSRKPEARRFDRLVRHEVLPSIRKYGCYPPPGTQLAPSHNPTQLDMMRELLAPIAENVVQLRKGMDEIKNKLLRGKWKKFSPEIEYIFEQVCETHLYGRCACGCGQLIMQDGKRIDGRFTVDHWNGPNHNGIGDGWPTAISCNQRFYNDARFKESKHNDFMAFQKMVERYVKEITQNARHAEPVKILEYRKPTQIKMLF